MPDSDFTSDPKLHEFATQAAESCVRLLGQGFGRIGDYTDASVRGVEEVLDILWKSIPSARPPQEKVQDYATRFGSYLGETYRRNHGGEWGIAGNGDVALRTPSGIICYPWNRVMKRLINGDEDEVLAWYHILIQYDAEERAKRSATPPPLPPMSSGPPPLPPRS